MDFFTDTWNIWQKFEPKFYGEFKVFGFFTVWILGPHGQAIYILIKVMNIKYCIHWKGTAHYKCSGLWLTSFKKEDLYSIWILVHVVCTTHLISLTLIWIYLRKVLCLLFTYMLFKDGSHFVYLSVAVKPWPFSSLLGLQVVTL